MDTRLPKLVAPDRLAAKRESLAGELPESSITRLATLYDIAGPVEVSLSFSPARFGRSAIAGNLNAELNAQCQRCLKPVTMRISHTIDVEVLDLDQFVGEPTQIHEAEAEDTVEYRSKLNVYEWLEDELVLATPIIPRHAQHECSAPDDEAHPESGGLVEQGERTENGGNMPRSAGSDDMAPHEGDESRQTTRPFAGLAEMIKSDD